MSSHLLTHRTSLPPLTDRTGAASMIWVYSGDGMGFAAVLQSLGVSVLDVVASMRRLVLPPVEVAPFTRPQVTRHPRL
ncbi:hypothetical protein [Parafrankia sp. EUN1f]|uniref:hypothetical protein n=1 Tax=Parafrankia sp. EUN1f TaxID=102897 RepID=UPI0001C45A3A|nr:hypothetical protein [Parafrankia sp. EUN1f]EFC83250.1 hypothetical protein FrEUN1fDRAFT_3630 [Parafrankia sp. EUN1f]